MANFEQNDDGDGYDSDDNSYGEEDQEHDPRNSKEFRELTRKGNET